MSDTIITQKEPTLVRAEDIVSTEMPPVTGAETPVEAAPQRPQTETATVPANVEKDSANVPYDPLRHLPKKHPKTGRWMPRKPRKNTGNTTEAASPPTASASQSFIPTEEPPPVTTSEANTPQADGTAPTDRPAMPVASAKAVAECATNAGYALTGALIGNHKIARPTAAEHANLRDTTAAYLDARGVRIMGGVAIVVGVVAYLIGDERREAVWEGIKNGYARLTKRQRPMTDVTPPKTDTPPQTETPKPTHTPASPKTAFATF